MPKASKSKTPTKSKAEKPAADGKKKTKKTPKVDPVVAQLTQVVAEAKECLAVYEKQVELETKYEKLVETCKETPPPLPEKRLVLVPRSAKDEEDSDEEESDEDDSSEEETKKGAKAAAADDDDDEESDDDDDDEKEDEDNDEEESDEESDDDDDDDDDDEEEEEEKPKAGKKEEESDDDDDEEESDEDDDEDDDEEEDDDDDDDDEDEDEDDDDDEEEKDTKMDVDVNKKRKAEEAAPPAAKKAKGNEEPQDVFVGNLSFDVDEALLYETFPGAAQVRLPVFADSGKPRGFAFVQFNTAAEAEAACTKMNQKDLLGRPLNVRLANSESGGGGNGGAGGGGGGGRAPEGTECFMGNLSWDIDEDGLRKWLGDIPLASVRWIEKDGSFTGCGFARFNTPQDAQKAAAKSGQDCLGREIRIEIAKPREARGSGGGRGGGRGGGGRGGGRNSFGGGGRRF